MLAGDVGTLAAIAIGFGGCSANRGDSDFMYCTTSLMSLSDRRRSHPGIALPYSPRRTEAIRSSSVGIVPDSVERILYLPEVKSRGRGTRNAADGPSPLPP